MRTIPRIIASLILISALAAATHMPARADIAPPEAPAGSSLWPGDSPTQVRMVSETVTLEVEPDPADEQGAVAHTTAMFSMRNLGTQEEQLQVRFPLDFVRWDSGWYAEIGDLRVKVNGKSASTKREVLAYSSGGDFGMKDVEIPWAVFDMSFPPAEDVSIEVSYTVPGYGYYPYEDFRYILETGAGWKDTIGSADIVVQLPYEANGQNIWRDADTGYSDPSPEGVLSGNEIRWHLEDFEPTAEDNIEVSLVAPRLWQRLLKEQQAVAADAKDGEAWGRLAKAYKEIIRMPKGYLRNDPTGLEIFQLSREAYEKCVALLPEDSLWHTGYAELLWLHYYFDVYMSGQSQEAGLLSTVLSELQTALQLDPQNKLADQLLEEISYSIPGAVRRGESGYVLLGLTQTVLPPTAYILETPTETPAQPAPATSTPSPEPSPTAPVITQPSPTSLPPGRVPNPLCGAGALPALGGILWAARRRKDPKRN